MSDGLLIRGARLPALVVAALVAAAVARATPPPPSRYPLDLDVAIARAYPGELAGDRRSAGRKASIDRGARSSPRVEVRRAMDDVT